MTMRRFRSHQIGLLLAGFLIALIGLPRASGEQRGPQLLERLPHAKEPRHDRRGNIRVDVDLTLVPVTVTDPMGRIVNGLERDNFKVFDEGEERPIVAFSSQDAPISVGLVFDLSGSMSDKLSKARSAITAFLGTVNPQDEVSLTTFSDRPDMRVDFGSDPAKLQNSLLFVGAHGRTALIDAVYSALQYVRKDARNPRKALVVVSDGGDNNSRYTLGELKSFAMEAETQIYAIGLHDNPRTPEELSGLYLLEDIAEATGGRQFVIRNVNELSDVVAKIGIALHNQYVIGYYPPEETLPGKYRKIRIKLNVPKGLPSLRVYARGGYYAPQS